MPIGSIAHIDASPAASTCWSARHTAATGIIKTQNRLSHKIRARHTWMDRTCALLIIVFFHASVSKQLNRPPLASERRSKPAGDLDAPCQPILIVPALDIYLWHSDAFPKSDLVRQRQLCRALPLIPTPPEPTTPHLPRTSSLDSNPIN